MQNGLRLRKKAIAAVDAKDDLQKRKMIILDEDSSDDEVVEVLAVARPSASSRVPAGPVTSFKEPITIEDDEKSSSTSMAVIDLVGDESEDDFDYDVGDEGLCPSTKKQPVTLTIEDMPEEELVAYDLKQKKQRTLTWQYIQELEIDTDRKSRVQLKRIKKNCYAVQSTFYAQHKDQKVTLEKLISAIPALGKEGAQRLLSPASYIDDSAIDLYFNYLSAQNPGVVNLSCHKAKLKTFNQRLRANEFASLREQCKAARRILWPICDGAHWYLIIIDRVSENQFNIYCLDSLNTATQAHFSKAKNFLDALYHESTNEVLINKEEHITVHEQDNGVDCGAAISFWGLRCAQNKTLPKSQSKNFRCDYSSFRVHMADTLAENFAAELEREKKERSSIKKK